MTIVFGSDSAGHALKAELITLCERLGHTARDCGLFPDDPNDYPIVAVRAAKLVQAGVCERGILVCGTGIGMALAANKIRGIRCANCSDPYSAHMARAHNDAQMLSLGARVTGSELCKMIVLEFLATAFEGGRHQRRVDQMMQEE